MQLRKPASIEESWCQVFEDLGVPQALLACTFTFSAEYFRKLLGLFEEASIAGADNDRSFSQIPINVVCDRTQYKGHSGGFNVTLSPISSRLFHPKLFIAIFHKEVVWSDGSLNLTREGWTYNREIAIFHRPQTLKLPQQLRKLLGALPEVEAASLIYDGTKEQRVDESKDRFLTSLDQPIGEQFLKDVPDTAKEVHLVAPFFEVGDSRVGPVDDGWLKCLAKACPRAHFHIYLPQLQDNPLYVQGSNKIFKSLLKRIHPRPVIFHPIAPDPGPLHGKIACIVHPSRKALRARVLVGSPNMTCAALINPSSNIETAWIVDKPWEDVKRVFSRLGAKGYSIDEVDFKTPIMSGGDTWMPLSKASYDPIERELTVSWKINSDEKKTHLKYNGKPISPDCKGRCCNFDLVDNISWLETINTESGKKGFCPINVPVELFAACRGGTRKRTPDEWLKMLGSLSADAREEENTHAITKHSKSDSRDQSGYKWSERVRDLASRMRYVREVFEQETTPEVDKKLLRRLFQKIYNEYDPQEEKSEIEKIWRIWVRINLWHTAQNLSLKMKPLNERKTWEKLIHAFRRELKASYLSTSLSKPLRSQIRAVLKTLGAIS